MKKITVLLLLTLIVGTIFGFFLSSSFKKSTILERVCLEKYSFINPFLGCNTKFVIKKTGYTNLKFNIETYLKKQKSEGKIAEVSVYFRDLISGPWMGIEEDNSFTPARVFLSFR